MKRFVKRKIVDAVSPVLDARLAALQARIETLEYRSFNRRFYAVEQSADYLVGAKIPGDYLEFGVYQGATFRHAWRTMSWLFPEMRFIAFDSFEGLPAPKGIDADGGYSSNFHAAEFRCDEGAFLANLSADGVDLSRVKIVKGWFDRTLAPGGEGEQCVGKTAFAWIDCDLYESTVPVLSFLTRRIVPGSVIAFDDWRSFRNHPGFGEQRACREWLAANPQIVLNELFAFGSSGIAFTVTSC
ncbi:MAG TPA: TylF/MycF/NovP-related O-methyltransferase [Candidatus Deferrimicrobiaceae bacterium]